MEDFLKKLLKLFEKLNKNVDKIEDNVEDKIKKIKRGKTMNKINKVLQNEKLKNLITVIGWILVAFIAYLAITFIAYPITFILFILLMLIVMPAFNKFLKDKNILIPLWKKIVLFILISLTIIVTAPINSDGALFKGIEGIDFKINNNNSVVLNDENLKVVPYAVNYYYDNVLTKSERYEANLYDVITFYEDGSQGGRYELVTENNFPLEINSENLKNNVINIYYKTPSRNTEPVVPENINENQDSEALTKEEINNKEIVLESKEKVEWSAQTFTASTYEEVKNILNTPVDSSTKNVVYTVQYIYDGEIDDSATDYFVVPIGSKVESCVLKAKEGFIYQSSENCPLTVKDNSQVIKIRYDRDLNNSVQETTETSVENPEELKIPTETPTNVPTEEPKTEESNNSNN